MEQLWAPWRAEYFQIEKPAGCVFCSAASQVDSKGDPSTDEKNYVLIREKNCFALLNAFPYSGGHVMVSPYKHSAELDDFTDDEMKDLFVLVRKCKNALLGAFKAHGFNVGLNLGTSAGAGIPDHLHIHIVPRWSGDTNFMPILSGTRVLTEGLVQSYQKLKPYFTETHHA